MSEVLDFTYSDELTEYIVNTKPPKIVFYEDSGEPIEYVRSTGWIPVSERLPDSRTYVIVSCRDDSGDSVFDYVAGGWLTTDKEYWIVDDEINNYVTAWCELPEPYKGEE